jgi:hypothetical protein
MTHPAAKNGSRRIAFQKIAGAALERADTVVPRWLPGGRRDGAEWIARNPTRDDRRPGSFKVNLKTGKWADFARGDCGGNLIALASYLFELPYWRAALKVADMLGVNPYEQ